MKSIWKNKALKIDSKDPYILTSGSLSPIYIDCRLLISDVEFRKIFTDLAAEKLKNVEFDYLAGGATGGIPYASFIAEKLGRPMIYIRKDPKGHGRAAQIEGVEDLDDKTVVLVEDLITEGISKLRFMGGIKRAGGEMNHCLVLFDREQNGERNLREHGVELISLVTLDEVLDYGLENGFIEKSMYDEIRDYLSDPGSWERSFKSE